jgi:hypothetical protein
VFYAPAPSIDLEERATGGFESGKAVSEPVDRKLIRRVNLQIKVQDFESSTQMVAGFAENAGGFVSGSNSYVTDSGRRRGTITIRVPDKEFFAVLDRLEEVGEVEAKTVSSEDVTEEYIDLEARLENLKRQEKRLLEIFDKAETVEDILKVEEQLGRVRGESESLTVRLRYLENRITLSTVSVELYEPEPITRSFGLRDSVRMAVEAFVGTVNGIIVFTGFILPVVVILAVFFFFYSSFTAVKGRNNSRAVNIRGNIYL